MGEGITLVPESPAALPGEGQMGNIGFMKKPQEEMPSWKIGVIVGTLALMVVSGFVTYVATVFILIDAGVMRKPPHTPDWVVPLVWGLTAIAFLIPGVIVWYSLRRTWRSSPGYCTACGYDLRGSKGSTNCPECGEALPRPAAQDAGA